MSELVNESLSYGKYQVSRVPLYVDQTGYVVNFCDDDSSCEKAVIVIRGSRVGPQVDITGFALVAPPITVITDSQRDAAREINYYGPWSLDRVLDRSSRKAVLWLSKYGQYTHKKHHLVISIVLPDDSEGSQS